MRILRSISGVVHFLLPSSPVFISVVSEYLVLSFVTLLTKSQFHINSYHYHLPDMPSVVESTTSLSLNMLNIPRPQGHGLQIATHASGGQSNNGHQLVQYLHTLRTQLLRTLRTKLATQFLLAIFIFALILETLKLWELLTCEL
jgi:hypothetical protein